MLKETIDNLDILLLKIRNKYPSLTNASKKIAEYILANYSEAVYLNITQLAKKTKVAESTITKFVRAIGYDSFHDLKLSLARITAAKEDETSYCGNISLDDNIQDICIVKVILHQNILSLYMYVYVQYAYITALMCCYNIN